MPPRRESGSSSIEDIVTAMRDERVLAAIGSIFETKMQSLLQKVQSLELENTRLKTELNDAQVKIDQLEGYSRVDNLVIVGLPVSSYAEMASTSTATVDSADVNTIGNPTAASVELNVLDLFNNRLGLSVTSSDISIAHRLKSKRDGDIPPIIVRFTRRQTREAVFAARRKLKGWLGHRVFINEDLTKRNAEIFQRSRKLVKDKRLHGTWTNGGVVFIKRFNDPSCKSEKIVSMSQLDSV